MLKSILLFIKAHAVVTAITTIVVVGAAVATPIVVDNYKLENAIKQNMNMLVQSDNQAIIDNQEIVNEQKISNSDETLTFRIEKVKVENSGSGWEEDENGVRTPTSGGTSIEYRVIPSYDKDVSKWTKEEKEEYIRVAEQANTMARADYDGMVVEEAQNMANALNNLAKEEASYSKRYIFWLKNANDGATSEEWYYNSFTKKYYGSTFKYNLDTDGGRITISDFRNIVYPNILQKINMLPDDVEDKQNMLGQLNELLNLSN